MICKEISKLFEEYKRIEVNNLENIDINLKGEITLVISPILTKNSNFLDDNDKKRLKN